MSSHPPGSPGPPSPAPGRVRRAPDSAERQRDAERTRQRILDAALAEFADKGYAGARVRAIAERAGANAQLISYYFGGKEGLYRELLHRWHQREADIDARDLALDDLVVAYLQNVFDQPELTRIFTWEGLSQTAPPDLYPPDGGDAPEVADLRRRQAAGEIAADVDPPYLLVALMGAVNTPVTMPQVIQRVCGVAADSDEFRSAFAAQLRTILGHLRGAGADRPAADGSDGGAR